MQMYCEFSVIFLLTSEKASTMVAKGSQSYSLIYLTPFSAPFHTIMGKKTMYDDQLSLDYSC